MMVCCRPRMFFALFLSSLLVFPAYSLDEDALKPCFERYENAKITDAQPFHSEWRMKNEEQCLKFCAKTTSRCKSIVYDRYSHVCHYFMESGVQNEKIVKNSRMTYFELIDRTCAIEKMLPDYEHQDFEMTDVANAPEEQTIPGLPVEDNNSPVPTELPIWMPPDEDQDLTEPTTSELFTESRTSVSTSPPTEPPPTTVPTTLGTDEVIYYPDQEEFSKQRQEEKPPTYEDYQDLLKSLPDFPEYDSDKAESEKARTTTLRTVEDEDEPVLVEPIKETMESSSQRPSESRKQLLELEPGVEGPIKVEEASEIPFKRVIEEGNQPEKIQEVPKVPKKVQHKSFTDFKPVITSLNSELEGAALLPAMNVFKADRRQQKQSEETMDEKLEKILKNQVEIRRKPVSQSANPKEQVSEKEEAYLAIIKHLVEKLDKLPEKEPERVQVRPSSSSGHRPTSSSATIHRRPSPPKNVSSLEKLEPVKEIEPISPKSIERSDPVLVRPPSKNERFVVPVKPRDSSRPLNVVKISRPKAVALEDERVDQSFPNPLQILPHMSAQMSQQMPEPILPIPLKMMENSKLKMKIEKTQDVELITEPSMMDFIEDDDCPKDSNQVWIAIENSRISQFASSSARKSANSPSECMEICNNLMVDNARCNSFTFNEVARMCQFYAEKESISIEPMEKKDFKTRAFRRLCFDSNLSPFYHCSEFMSFREFTMHMTPREEFEGLPANATGFSACVELCVLSPDFKCLSASFDFSNQKCRVYDQSSVSDPSTFKEHYEPNMLYFENGCQNQGQTTVAPEHLSVQRVQQRLRPVKIDLKKRVKRV